MRNSLRTVHGVFYPTSFFVKTIYSKEEIRLSLKEAKYFVANPDIRNYVPKYDYVINTLFHEWFHHLQISATRFGRALDFLTNLSGAGFSKCISEIFNNHNPNKIYRPCISYLIETEIILKTEFIGAAYYNILKIALLGFHQSIGKYNQNIPLPQNKPCPEIVVNNNKFMIGGYHIMECHAHCNEKIMILTNPQTSICHKLNSINDITIFYPYEFLLHYVKNELLCSQFPLKLTSLVCDISLNGDFGVLNESTSLTWEDIHPGWRFVRIVDYLKKHIKPKIKGELDLENLSYLNFLHNEIYNQFKWDTPKEKPLQNYGKNSYFLKQANLIRSKNALAIALPNDFINELVEKFPLDFGRQVPAEFTENSSKKEFGLDARHTYEAHCFLGAIFESTVFDVLGGQTVICPWHDTDFSFNDYCSEACVFPTWFRSVFSIDIKDFLNIPYRRV